MGLNKSNGGLKRTLRDDHCRCHRSQCEQSWAGWISTRLANPGNCPRFSSNNDSREYTDTIIFRLRSDDGNDEPPSRY